jgi:ElaB/YqjD/DUF883 family membrane-anchored ribosome-binding protein
VEIMAEKNDPDMKTLAAELGDLRADIAKIHETLTGIVRNRGNDAFDALQASASKMAEAAKKAGESAVHEVEERPFLAMASAFALGLAIGVLCHRRS